MKNDKNDRMDQLIRLAWLEGWVTTHGAYEKAVMKRSSEYAVSLQARSRLIGRLEQALKAAPKPVPLTIGAMLKKLRAERSLKSEEIFSRIGLSANIFRLMEHDAISPVKISADVWAKLTTLLDLSVEELEHMLRRTHQLVFFRPSLKQVLARYSTTKKKGQKSLSLEQAFSEMFAKADLHISQEEEKKLDRLIADIRSQRNRK